MAVVLKRGHCEFAFLLILYAVSPTIYLQSDMAVLVERKRSLDRFIVRWTWELWWCVLFFQL